MNVFVRTLLLALLLVSHNSLSVAEDSKSFNGQPLDATLQVVKTKAYGKFKPSQFSNKGKVVLVSWNSEEGKKRLFRSKFNNDFFQLANHYQPQANPLY
ncbi:hypothetical protein, partial [Kaarinaea lacus]